MQLTNTQIMTVAKKSKNIGLFLGIDKNISRKTKNP
jgi:hypothetical protein